SAGSEGTPYTPHASLACTVSIHRRLTGTNGEVGNLSSPVRQWLDAIAGQRHVVVTGRVAYNRRDGSTTSPQQSTGARRCLRRFARGQSRALSLSHRRPYPQLCRRGSSGP